MPKNIRAEAVLEILRSRIIAVYVLTITDVFLTAIGIRMGFISEANPILGEFMQCQPVMCALFICAFVGLMLAVIYHLGPRVRFTVPMLTGLCGVKICVIRLHIVWIRLAVLGA